MNNNLMILNDVQDVESDELESILTHKIIQDNNFTKSVIKTFLNLMDYSEDEMIEMINKGGLVF
jgi:hypothetical protein